MNKKLIFIVSAVALLAVITIGLQPGALLSGATKSEPASTSNSSTQAIPQASIAPPSTTTPGAGQHDLVLPEHSMAGPQETEVDLWHLDQAAPDTLLDGNPAKRLQTDPALIEQFHVGQKLQLNIPQRDLMVEAELKSTHNQSANVHVFRGKILDGHPQDNVIVSRGRIETHVVISTYEGTYSAIIDNETGETVMIDQADITANQIPFDDAIPVEPVEQYPPLS